MNSIRGFYFRPTDNPNVKEIVVIMRRPKPKSKLRNIMWWAWQIKWDHFAAEKYKEYEHSSL